MEPKGSLPLSQVPTICPYPEPARSIPYPLSHFLKIHLNIILPSMLGSPKWSLSLRFPQQSPVYASPLSHTRHMPDPSHSSRFYHPQNIGWAVQIIKLLVKKFSPLRVTSSLLDPNFLLNTLISSTLILLSSLNVSDHPHKTTGKIIFLYIVMFKFLDSKLEDKIFCTKWQQAFPDINLLLISFWTEFWFVNIVPKYFNSSTLSKKLLSIFILWLHPAFWS